MRLVLAISLFGSMGQPGQCLDRSLFSTRTTPVFQEQTLALNPLSEHSRSLKRANSTLGSIAIATPGVREESTGWGIEKDRRWLVGIGLGILGWSVSHAGPETVYAQSSGWIDQVRSLIQQLDDPKKTVAERRALREELLRFSKAHPEYQPAYFFSQRLNDIGPQSPHAGKVLLLLIAQLGERLQAEARVNSFWRDYGMRAEIFKLAIRLAYFERFVADFKNPGELYSRSLEHLQSSMQNLLKSWTGSQIVSVAPYERDRDAAVGFLIGLFYSDRGREMLKNQPRGFWGEVRRILLDAEVSGIREEKHPLVVDSIDLIPLSSGAKTEAFFVGRMAVLLRAA